MWKNLGKSKLYKKVWESILYTIIAGLSLTLLYGLFQLVLNLTY